MATSTTTRAPARTLEAKRPSSSRQKKDRTDIWSNLLRQTREAQARNRTQAIQDRSLILCGGSADDQRAFLDRYLARPPPIQPTSRNARDQKPQRQKGEVRLSNRFGYGYGYVSLHSPPQSSSGASGLFSGEAEEVAKIDVHTLPEPEHAYEVTLRRLLQLVKEKQPAEDVEDPDLVETDVKERIPAVCILMSWKEPWVFMRQLRLWLALLSRALLPPLTPTNDEPSLEGLQEHNVRLTVVLQHTEQQESLLRDMYTEEMFDYISQCLRTCLLPLAAALVYVPTNLPPQAPGSALSEVQKILYTSLDLNVAALQIKGGKPDLTPKHNVVDRTAIVVPSGWDSMGKIRLLSETFSPETVLEGWKSDMAVPAFPKPVPPMASTVEGAAEEPQNSAQEGDDFGDAAEVFESSSHHSPLAMSPQPSPPMSPSKMPKSALTDYEEFIQDTNAHKAPQPPQLEVTTKPEQEFLAEMRAQLQQYEAQDAAARAKDTSSANTGRFDIRSGGVQATGEALNELGDVSFNVGGVSYDTHSAEQAIEKLKRPQAAASSDSRSSTPRPSRKDHKTGSDSTPGSKGSDIPTEKLEEYFASLMKRGGGGSQSGTPTK